VKRNSTLKGSLAAVSAVAGILAGVLGAWLTGHWLWGAACGILVLLGVVAGTEALKGSRETTNMPGATNISGNAISYETFIAGRDINQNRINNDIDQSRTTNIRFAGGAAAALVAILAFAGATGGTIYISQQPHGIAMESPQNLANEGSHSSPDAAVEGFLGDALLNDGPGACSYLLPDEQNACNISYASSRNGESENPTDSVLGVGNEVISGTLALVPVIGKLCLAGSCQSNFNKGLPHGESFQAAFQQAMTTTSGNLIPCEQTAGLWYVDFPGL
jgi:hypothetical protein